MPYLFASIRGLLVRMEDSTETSDRDMEKNEIDATKPI